MAQESWKRETDETEYHNHEGPILGANNCGFFGSAATNNLCSKCYRDQFMKQQSKTPLVVPVAEKMSIASTSVQFKPVVERLDKVEENNGPEVARLLKHSYSTSGEGFWLLVQKEQFQAVNPEGLWFNSAAPSLIPRMFCK